MIYKPKFKKILFLLALSSSGLGDYFLGIYLHQNFVTIILLILGCFLLGQVQFPKWIVQLAVIILFQTFVFNNGNINFFDSLSHFIGLFVILTIIYSYLKSENLVALLKSFYSISYYLTLLSFLQIILFLIFDYSFLPQSIISGQPGNEYSREIFNVLPRVSSVFSEPAHYTLFLLPSAYVSCLQFLRKLSVADQISTKKSIIILVGFFITFSFVGYVMLILSLIPALIKRKRFRQGRLRFKKIILLFLIPSFCFLLYNSVTFAKVTSLINLIADPTKEITASDYSGYAIDSNYFVAYNSSINTRFLGSGLNTHKLNYEKYVDLERFRSKELNKMDGASLYIRFLSEFGLIAFVLLGIFLFKNKIPFNYSRHYYINNLSLMMILSYGIRNGSYISIFLLLFLSMYYLSFIGFRAKTIKPG